MQLQMQTAYAADVLIFDSGKCGLHIAVAVADAITYVICSHELFYCKMTKYTMHYHCR